MFARFRPFIPSTVLLLLSVYIFKLGLIGKLGLYVHPRFHLFTVVCAAALALLTISYIVINIRARTKASDPKRLSVVSGLTIVVVILALILPPVPLSPSASSQRLSVKVAKRLDSLRSEYIENTCDGTLRRKQPNSINTWQTVMANCQRTGSLNGKQVTLTGFVVGGDDRHYGDNTFYLGRYFIACCTVDAEPIMLPVEIEGSVPRTNSWVKVTGMLEASSQNDSVYVIKSTSLQQVSEPKDPYEYLVF